MLCRCKPKLYEQIWSAVPAILPEEVCVKHLDAAAAAAAASSYKIVLEIVICCISAYA